MVSTELFSQLILITNENDSIITFFWFKLGYLLIVHFKRNYLENRAAAIVRGIEDKNK